MDKKPKKNIEIKKEKVAQLSQKIKEAKSIIFADYTRLSAEQMAKLRRKIKESGGEFIIAKNTLIKRALTSYRLPVTSNQLAGPTATLFAYNDEIAPIKVVAEIAKTQGTPKFKFGFFGKDFLDTEAVENLSKIPGWEILHANVVGALSSPIYGFVNVLQANIRNLISVLDQKAKIQ